MKPPVLNLPKFTRHFTVVATVSVVAGKFRVIDKRVEELLDICDAINATLIFKTVKEGDKERLFASITLRGPPAYPGMLVPWFPNFLISPLPSKFDDGMDWLLGMGYGSGIKRVSESAIFTNNFSHPFDGLRKKLFFDTTPESDTETETEDEADI